MSRPIPIPIPYPAELAKDLRFERANLPRGALLRFVDSGEVLEVVDVGPPTLVAFRGYTGGVTVGDEDRDVFVQGTASVGTKAAVVDVDQQTRVVFSGDLPSGAIA